MSKQIIAIGGGKVMMPSVQQVETLTIDRAIVRAADASKPKVLFIPTASEDNPDYCQAIETLYAKLGCRVEHLLLYRDRPTSRNIRKMILQADIIYVGGGNTLRMMKLWRKLKIDAWLQTAYHQGTVMCGLSAGAICWFAYGNSDSRKFADQSNQTLIKVRGLGLVNLVLCPHYDTEKHRQQSLKQMMQKYKGVAVALENNSALHLRDEQYRILTANKACHAWKIHWHDSQYHKADLTGHARYRSMTALLQLQDAE